MSPEPLPPLSRPRRGRPFNCVPLLACLAFIAGGCGSDSTGPGDPSPVQAEVAPEVTGLRVTKSSTTYLQASVTASVTDSNNNVGNVVVNWGDGQTFTVTSQFDAISVSHDYARDAAYTVTVTATDLAGNKTTGTGRLTLDPVPGGCFDVYVLKLCAQIQPDYRGIEMSVSSLNIVLKSFTLNTTSPGLTTIIPVGGLVGQLKVEVTSSISRTKGRSYVTVNVYGCTLILICSDALGSKTFTW